MPQAASFFDFVIRLFMSAPVYFDNFGQARVAPTLAFFVQ
jgi:hypothetical protein